MSRSVEKMHPDLKEKYDVFVEIMAEKQIPYLVTCVDRNITEQMALYAQGRLPLKDVNRYREAAGLCLLPQNENKKVTWTLKSKHIVDPSKGIIFSRAFDFVVLKEDKPTWNLKVDVNRDDIPDYIQVGKIWESIGGKAGYRFNDYCHLEV